MKTYNSLLLELFDKPWQLEDITNSNVGDHIRNEIQNQYNKVSRYKLYKAEGNNGHIIEFHNVNAMEIHHIDNDGLIRYNSKPNPRYISTMLDRIKYHTLQKNRNVRIVSSNKDLVNHYHRIGKLLSKKEPVDVSDITEYNNNQSAFYISPRKNIAMTEMIKKYNTNKLGNKFIHFIDEMVLKNQKKIVVTSNTCLLERYNGCKEYIDGKPIILGEIQDNKYFTLEPFVANKYEKIIECFNEYRRI